MKLVNFLTKLQNETVQVELKNGTLVQGTLLSVSPLMNMTLKNVQLTAPQRQPTSLEHITVRGNTVRLVLLPDELNIDAVLQDPVFKPKKQQQPAQEDSVKRRRIATRGF